MVAYSKCRRRNRWIDIDLPTKRIHVTPEKGSNPRTLPISDKALIMIYRLKKTNEYIFKTTLLKHNGAP